MITPIQLRLEQKGDLYALNDALEDIMMNDFEAVSTENLARLKARCQEFLEWPIIQALNTEGL